MKTIILSSAVALCVALGGPASAAVQRQAEVVGQRPDPDSLTVRVGFADLDLTSASDQRRLNFRVGSAVRQVCAPLEQAGQRIENTVCRSFAWSGARPQIARAIAAAQMAELRGSTDTAVASIAISAPARL